MGREKSRPYTALYLMAMEIGFTTSDLRTMSYPNLLWFFYEWSNIHSPKKSDEDEVRDATVADIHRILG